VSNVFEPHPLQFSRLVATRFVYKRKNIPSGLRSDNIRTFQRALSLVKKSSAPSPSIGELSLTQQRVESLRHLERLWGESDTTFAAFDVVAVDPVREAYDTAPFNGGNYPKAPRPRWSEIGSTAGMCADAAG
jgi:hypothetical protein